MSLLLSHSYYTHFLSSSSSSFPQTGELSGRPGSGLDMLFSEELEGLQKLLHFPEEVALKLTEVEYDLYYRVPPIAYIRHVTSDLRPPRHHTQPPGYTQTTVSHLTKRFKEVGGVWCS